MAPEIVLKVLKLVYLRKSLYLLILPNLCSLILVKHVDVSY